MGEQTALIVEVRGGPYVIQKRPIPSPGKGELLVKVHAAALNPVDWKLRVYDFGIPYPVVLGTDLAGEIEQIGEGVQGWAKGDRVFFQGSYSDGNTAGFQQYALISAKLVAKIPERMSFSQATTFMVGLTVVLVGLWAPKPQGLNLEPSWDLKPRASGPAVVIGGSSSVGQYAIQVLRISGYSPIITYASASHAKHLESLGATHVIDRKTTPLTGLVDAIGKITDSPVKLAFDAISDPETQQAAYNSVADGGKLVIVLNENVIRDDSKNVEIKHPWGSVHPINPFGLTLFENLGNIVEAGAIVPNRVEELPEGLQAIIDGLERLEKGVSGIKLVGHP